jgi:hypothetical protein
MRLNVDPRIVQTAAVVVSGMLANKLVSYTWEKATGRPTPADASHPDIDIREAVAYAVFSGTLIALSRLIALRSATRYLLQTPERHAD